MASYTVKKGDTLSGIASNHGVDYKSITGYKSGNPNLIYPGEVLTWGSPAPASSAPASPAPVNQAENAATAQVDSANKKVSTLNNELASFDANAQNPIDIYNRTLETLGIGDARTRVGDLREQLLNTENLIKNVTGDVSARTQDSLVSENQRRRLVATEQAPLAQQAADEGRRLEVALSDYKDIMSEGKAQTEMEYLGQKDTRAALMDRLQLAIKEAETKEDKRRYEKEYARLVKKDNEEKARWEKEFNLEQQKFAYEKSKPRGSSGGSSGSSGPSKSQFMVAAFSGYKPASEGGQPFYTEREVIPAMMANFNMTREEAAKQVYKYRQEVFGEG